MKVPTLSVLFSSYSARTRIAVLDAEEAFLSNYCTGEGINLQLGYLFENNVEPAFRYTFITPEEAGLASDRDAQRMYTFGLSKYVVGHALKVQTDLSFIDESAEFSLENDFDMLFRFQVEMAFLRIQPSVCFR